MNRSGTVLSLCLAACACGVPLAPDAECTRGLKESDLTETGWSGPGVKADGSLPVIEDAVLSTTFLRLKVDGATGQKMQQLVDDVSADLKTRDGLVGWRSTFSVRCNSARTLAVWRDESAMFSFVTGKAHTAAIRDVGLISRGGAAVTHWRDSSANANLETALAKINAVDAF